MKNKTSLKSQSVINPLVVSAIVMSLVLFYFIPYLTEQYTIRTIIAHSKNSVEQIKLTRAYYIDVVVNNVKKYAPNLSFHYDHWGVDGRLPLPATTVHDLSEIFSEKIGLRYNLYSEYPFLNRKDRVLTQFQKDAIKYTKESPDGTYIKRDVIDGEEVLRVATADYMTDISCVDCHNKHPDKTWEEGKWLLGDKRGVLEVITPLKEDLASHIIMRNYIIILVLITFGFVLFYLFFKMRKRENKLFEVADELEHKVDDKNRKLKTLGDLLDKYVISSKTDKTGKITYVSQAFIDISGYSREELVNQQHNIVRHPDMPSSAFFEMWKSIESDDVWRGEIKNLKKDGGFYWVDAIVSPDYDLKKNIIGYTALRIDITAQKEAHYLAEHDFLTSLPNRAKFENIAQHSIDIAKRNKSSLAVVFIDLDKFKNINDTLGHHVGDEMLKIVAQRMDSTLRQVDTIARISGDEFVLLLETLQDKKSIKLIIEKLIQELRAPLEISGNTLHITMSAGISVYPDDGENIFELMKNADSAMYSAKENGRDSYQFYTKELKSVLMRKVAVQNAMRKAIDENSFDFVYQPKYDLKNHKVVSCEILLRLNDEILGIIAPAEFIPIAEENHMILDIGDIVFKKATEIYKEYKDMNLGINTISINISNTQLENESIVEHFLNILEKNNVSAEHIDLEITEHSVMQNLEKKIELLNRFRSFGFKISIDDFGTGYSSMNYLAQLPIDTIKLDKSFVNDITKNEATSSVAHTTIHLAHDLGYSVIAEGIETQEQESVLKDLECQLGQGFLFCHGLSHNDFISFIYENKKL